LNEDVRATSLQHYLFKLDTGDVDLDRIIKMANRVTPPIWNISSSR
jgi:hypothetical protein